jgi:hypothetical protein
MKQSLKAGLMQALSLWAIGLGVGAVGGLAGLLLGRDAAGVATIGVRWHLALYPLLPLGLCVMTYASLHDADRVLYATPGRVFGLLLVAGGLGAVGAYLFFLTLALNIPAIFGRWDPMQLQMVVPPPVHWRNLAILVAVTIISALLLAGWACRQMRG